MPARLAQHLTLRPIQGVAAAWCLGALLLATGVQAQDGAAQLSQIGQRFIDSALHQPAADAPQASNGSPLRMEVQMGQLDPRLRLAACAKVEPYLPAGARLWGRTRIGLRCLQGPRAWNVYLPVTVQAFGPAWVLNNNVRQGEALTAGDASIAEADWAEFDSPVVANQPDWLGLEAARHLQAGQTLRQNMLRPPQLFAMGAQVKVSVSGGGFSIMSTGRAMAAGAEGANVRVRMDNGRLVSGVVNAQGVVEVK